METEPVKIPIRICQQIRKIKQWPTDWEHSIFIPICEKREAKECNSHRTIALISQTGDAQDDATKASTFYGARNAGCSSQIQKRKQHQSSDYEHSLDTGVRLRIPKEGQSVPCRRQESP